MHWGSRGPRVWTGRTVFHWLGFQGDSMDLARAGWQIGEESIDRPDSMMREHRIYLRHPAAHIVGEGRFHYRDSLYEYQRMRETGSPRNMFPPHLPIRMDMMAHDIRTNYAPPMFLAEPMHPYDKEFRIRPIAEQFYGLYDLQVFREAEPTAVNPKIILEQASVNDILELALEKQRPTQERIRQRMIRESKLAAEIRIAA